MKSAWIRFSNHYYVNGNRTDETTQQTNAELKLSTE